VDQGVRDQVADHLGEAVGIEAAAGVARDHDGDLSVGVPGDQRVHDLPNQRSEIDASRHDHQALGGPGAGEVEELVDHLGHAAHRGGDRLGDLAPVPEEADGVGGQPDGSERAQEVVREVPDDTLGAFVEAPSRVDHLRRWS